MTGGRVNRRLFLTGLLGTAALTACTTGVPGSGPVEVVSSMPPPANSPSVRPPSPGGAPDEIVRGFIEALGTSQTDAGAAGAYSAARQFLTPQLQKSWAPTSKTPIVIISDYRTDLIEPGTGVVRLTATSVGRLDDVRAYRSETSSEPLQDEFRLIRINGEWRISDLPAELVLTVPSFRRLYVQRRVYFMDRTGEVVVPDLRYVLSSGSAVNRAVRVLDMLLAGPSAALRGVVLNDLADVTLRTTLSLDTAGVAQVDLNELVQLSASQRRGLAAQVVWSLAQDLPSMRITLNAEPLDSTKEIWTAQSVSSFDPNRVRSSVAVAQQPFYVNSFDQVVNLATGVPLPGPLGNGDLDVATAALSATTGWLAAVVDREDGGQELVVGLPGVAEDLGSALQADKIAAPTFTRSGEDVWVAVIDPDTQATQIHQISVPAKAGGPSARSTVVLPPDLDVSRMRAMAISPDGVRIALAAGGKLFVGAISTADPTVEITGPEADVTSVVNLRELRPDLGDVAAVVFSGATELLVAAKRSLLYRTIVRVEVDGSDAVTTGATGLTGDVTGIATSGSEIYASFNGRIVRLAGGFVDGRWEAPAIGTGAYVVGSEPFFPS